jgi:hypothetical protein
VKLPARFPPVNSLLPRTALKHGGLQVAGKKWRETKKKEIKGNRKRRQVLEDRK